MHLQKARRQYIEALRLTRKALQSPELLTRDSTILSIILLDVFEKMSKKGCRHGGPWTAHVKGALSLVHIHGGGAYHNPGRMQMLERLLTNTLISCVVGDIAIPEGLVTLQSAVFPPPKLKESELMVTFGRLKRQAKHNQISNSEIIRDAVQLDVQFSKLSLGMPSSWQHKEVHVEERSAHHYDAYHYKYASEHMAQMWNVLRLTRILICDLILAHCFRPLTTLGQESWLSNREYAATAIAQLSNEICATLPQVLAQPANAKNHLSCYRLIFPLYVAGQSLVASEVIRQYAIQQLHFMADCHGIQNAFAVARMLESGERRNPWDVYALLGSYAFVC